MARCDDFVDIFEFEDGHDRAEDFFLSDLHVVLNIGENGGLDEVAFVADTIAAGEELGFFGFAGIDVAHDFVELVLVDLRTLFGIFVEGIADGALLGAGDGFLDEFVVALFFDEEARAGAAALTLIEEECEVGAFDGLVHVGVGENDVGTLAAEFESDALEIGFRGGFHDEVADFGGAGEGDFVDVHVASERGAGGGAVAGKQVDDAIGEAGFLDEFGNAQRGERSLLGGLHDDGAAGGERGAEFPGLHQQRKVPRNDLANDADGLVLGVGEVAAL